METDAAAVAARPKGRRWYQFSLRTLLIFVTLAGCGLGWIMHQAEVVAARKTWLGTHFGPPRLIRDLMRGYREPFTPDVAGDEHQSPSVARRWLGDETISDVLVEGGEVKKAAELFP